MKYSASTSAQKSPKAKQNQAENSLPPNTDYSQIDISKLSEMMQRYVEVKLQYSHALLLFRVGDFLNVFFRML